MEILFENARIFDGLHADFYPGWVGVDQGTIVAVESPSVAPPAETAKRINLKQCVVMPGLIDAHVHLGLDASLDPVSSITSCSPAQLALRMTAHAAATLAAGVTTVRDLGCFRHVDMAVRDAIKNGLVPGPRMLCAGQFICMTGGHGWQFGFEADGKDQIRHGVRRQVKAGADVVKFIATGGVCTKGVEPGQAQLTSAEMAAGIEVAHLAGRKTAAHAQSLPGTKNALDAGIDSIEHGAELDEAALETMVKNDIFLVPTLAAGACMIAGGTASGLADYIVGKAKAHRGARLLGLAQAKAAGVKIAMGTDAGTPLNLHGKNVRELLELLQAGFNPFEALRAATADAAELLGVNDRVGRIAPGCLADLLVVDGGITTDLCVLGEKEKILAVYQEGSLRSGLWFQTFGSDGP